MRSVFLVAFALGCATANTESIATDKPAEELRPCEDTSDCILVETACDSCCDYDAINEDFREDWKAVMDEKCDGFSGGVCDCESTLAPVCTDGLCRAE